MKLSYKLRVALPCILIFGGLGALVGGAVGAGANGTRIGIVFGGVVAFIILQRRTG